MKFVYLIVDESDNLPIITASTIEQAESLLDQYMGVSGPIIDDTVRYVDFGEYEGEYGDIYDGLYIYETDNGKSVQRFYRYCMVLDGLN
jgi:hypothetical protein